MKTPQNILIVKLSAIGDVIHALPVAHALKNGFPDCRLTWVVEKAAADLVKANSYVDEVIVFDKPQCKTWRGFCDYVPGFVSSLRNRRFDLAIDLQGLFKSAIISFLSGAPRRLVYCNARELSDWLGKKVCGPNQHGHIIDQYLDTVREVGIIPGQADFGLAILPDTTAAAVAIARRGGLDLSKRYIVLAPGANWPNKRWPPQHFAQLVDKLFAAQLIPVLIGGSSDDVLAKEISRHADIPPVDLTGKTTLLQLAHILRQAQAVIGGDTGPVHLAVAVGSPVVMLMGPTDANRNGPYAKRHVVLNINNACAGCWKRECPHQRDCLETITPNTVYAAVENLLRQNDKW